jgi:hypothetical protein
MIRVLALVAWRSGDDKKRPAQRPKSPAVAGSVRRMWRCGMMLAATP